MRMERKERRVYSAVILPDYRYAYSETKGEDGENSILSLSNFPNSLRGPSDFADILSKSTVLFRGIGYLFLRIKLIEPETYKL